MTTPPAPERLPLPAFDSHCHLDLMGQPVADAMAQARDVGITKVVTIGIDVSSSQWAVDAARSHPDVHAAVAVHPNEVANADDTAWERIEALAGDACVVAVGETGLDHYRTEADGWAAQEESFRRHIAIAKRTGKALVIHDRDAHDEVARVLDEEGPPDHVVFHCFSGDAAFARTCADRGYVMSFAGNVTFKNAGDLRAAAEVAPAELLLVETDAPFLTPVPYRGRPNAPYLVPLTLRALAEVKRMDVEALAAAMAATGRAVFRW